MGSSAWGRQANPARSWETDLSFFKEDKEAAENLGFFFSQLATRMFCLNVAFLKMLGLLGELRWGCAVGQGHLQSLMLPDTARVWSAAETQLQIFLTWLGFQRVFKQ